MSHITFITGVRPGELDILGVNNQGDLVVSDLDGNELFRIHAFEGWTHEKLEQLSREFGQFPDGADAHIGGCWVGSTEV